MSESKEEFVNNLIYGQQSLTEGFRRKVWGFNQGFPTTASTVGDSLNPLLLKYLPTYIYSVQIYFVDEIDNVPFKTYATVEIQGGYYIAMNPRHIKPDYPKGILHEIGHILDIENGKRVTPTGVKPRNFRKYFNLRSERRARDFETGFLEYVYDHSQGTSR